MAVVYKGRVGFEDTCQPAPSKSEFGMDTVTRVLKGSALLLQDFIKTIRTKTQCPGYEGCQLQNYSTDQNPVFPSISLFYKGLIDGNLPDAIGYDEYVVQTMTITTDSPQKASREIQFEALATRWLYITRERPIGGSMTRTSYQFEPQIREQKIILEDGTLIYGNADAGLVTALTPPVENRRLNFIANPVPGTIYFECEEVICRMFTPPGTTGAI
jgi:hypothetical protein